MDKVRTLQQVSRELRIASDLLATYLNDRGIKTDNVPSQKVTAEHFKLLQDEVSKLPPNSPLIYIADTDIDTFKSVNTPIEFWNESSLSNLEKLIYRQLSFEKPKIERVVSVLPFDWHFSKVRYEGLFSTGQKFTLFEDTIISLLNIRPNLTKVEIAQVLGFGIDTSIVTEVVDDLLASRLLIEGTSQGSYSVSDKGKEDLKTKTKSREPSSARFELVVDHFFPKNKFAKRLFDLPQKKTNVTEVQESLLSSLDEIKIVAEEQASQVHFPRTGHFLLEAKQTGNQTSYKLRFIAIITENLESKTNNIWIFDPYRRDISRQLSQIARNNESLQQLIKNSIVSEARQTGELIEKVKKDEIQLEFDQAIVNSENIDDTKLKVPELFRPFLTYDSLNTVEFELEMEKLFDAVQYQLWLIFPWVKDGAFQHRISLIRKLLKNNVNVFVGFSEKEGMVRGSWDKMVSDKSMEQLNELSLDHTNFFFAELSKFHEKRVFAFLDSKYKCEYSGSHNYLSFYVERTEKGFRKENMKRIVWTMKSDEEFEERKIEFIQSFCNSILKMIATDKSAITGNKSYMQLVRTKRNAYVKAIEKIDHLSKQFPEPNLAITIQKTRNEIEAFLVHIQ